MRSFSPYFGEGGGQAIILCLEESRSWARTGAKNLFDRKKEHNFFYKLSNIFVCYSDAALRSSIRKGMSEVRKGNSVNVIQYSSFPIDLIVIIVLQQSLYPSNGGYSPGPCRSFCHRGCNLKI